MKHINKGEEELVTLQVHDAEALQTISEGKETRDG